VPGEIAGLQVLHLVRTPRVSECIAAAIGEDEFDFAEIERRDHPHLAGKRVGELDLLRTTDPIVISVLDASGHQRLEPEPDGVLGPDETLIIVCREGCLDEVLVSREAIRAGRRNRESTPFDEGLGFGAPPARMRPPGRRAGCRRGGGPTCLRCAK
jgi:hypothetical protein